MLRIALERVTYIAIRRCAEKDQWVRADRLDIERKMECAVGQRQATRMMGSGACLLSRIP